MLPIVRFPTDEPFEPDTAFPMPDTALRTIANFDVTPADGRSTLFGRDVFKRDVAAGVVRPPIPRLPRLPRRFIVNNGGRLARRFIVAKIFEPTYK